MTSNGSRLAQRALTLAALCLFIGAAEANAPQGRLKAFSRSIRMRYNRVEGIFLGYRLGVAPRTWQGFGFFAEGGYGMHNQSPRWESGLEYQKDKTTFSLTLFDRTETNDRDITHTGENTVFTLLFKWDYQDYFRTKQGIEAKGAYRYRRYLRFLGRLSAFDYENMPLETGWSLFHPNRAFRTNPRIQPGDAGLLQLGFVLDTRIRSPIFRNAWHLSATCERGFRAFEYNGLILAVKRFQKVALGSQAFVVQARIGTRQSTHEQHLFDLGGVSTLRGYDIKEFTGNRMVMVNFDYLFGGDLLGRMPIRGLHLLNLILFFDAGWTHAVPKSETLLSGFGDLSLKDFKPNVGVGVGALRQFLRFNLALRLDRRNDPWVVSLRVKRKF